MPASLPSEEPSPGSEAAFGGLLQPGPPSCDPDLGSEPAIPQGRPLLLFPLLGGPAQAFLFLSVKATPEPRWLPGPPVLVPAGHRTLSAHAVPTIAVYTEPLQFPFLLTLNILPGLPPVAQW